jgi:phosphosulfolactate synthase
MKTPLPFLPERTEKPRQTGLAMIMDKGMGLREAADLIESAGHLADFVKLAFGTALADKKVKEKIRLFRENGVRVYVGGTLFEAFVIRGLFDDFIQYLDQLGVDTVEVSDGSMMMDHDRKCEYIHRLSRNFTVFSEVGSKESGILIAPARWIDMMQKELQAGAFKVIGEARESGTVGIYRPTGKAHVSLINKILAKVPADKILWEAPLKHQQVWFINNFGANVNLGNIAPGDLISLETLRLGLRYDTFYNYLPAHLKKLKPE